MSPPAPDPLGHALLRSRLGMIPGVIGEKIRRPLAGVSEKALHAERFVVAGTGSSEAHARFLVHLLNRFTDRAAEFVPLSAFCSADRSFGNGRTLIVVSQGISPNAQVAIDRAAEFDHAIVFTSTTAEGAEAAGKPERAALIRRLESEGVEFVRSPLEEEYSTLIRFVGPMAVYVSAHQFVRFLAPEKLEPWSEDAVADALRTAPASTVVETFLDQAATFRRGFYLLAASPLCEYAQNLGYKFLEGVFWSAPVIWDYLQFAHGPFQEVTLQPRPVVMLAVPGAVEADLMKRTRRMLRSAGVPFLEVPARATGPLAILEYEAIFNHIVMCLIERFSIDQRNWPSKGKDDPLYGFARVT